MRSPPSNRLAAQYPLMILAFALAAASWNAALAEAFLPTHPSWSSATTRSFKSSPSSSRYDFLSSDTARSGTKCREGSMTVARTIFPDDLQEEFQIAYQIHRPMTLSSQQAVPLLVLHGGPGVPSDYLQPLVQVVPYRSIVFYDQLGCGRSDEPQALEAYSMDQAVDDLEQLVQHLGLRQFHLLGQSFGGILGYEFLKRRAERVANDDDNSGMSDAAEVLSFTVSSTPTSVPLVESEVEALLTNLMSDMKQDAQGGNSSSSSGSIQNVETRFQQTHICRIDGDLPQPLQDAYAHAGTVWRGSGAIADYVAQPPLAMKKKTETTTILPKLPPLLVMRGEHDFVTAACTRAWKQDLWKQQERSAREVELAGTSHHGLLENGPLFGSVVESFLAEYDP